MPVGTVVRSIPKRSLFVLAIAGAASLAQASNKVLVWSTGNNAFGGHTEQIAAYLTASGKFDSVDWQDTDSALPYSTLNTYDRVLYFSNASNLQDPAAIGNVLADYADSGRRLALGVFSWADQGGNTLGGRIISDGISPFTLTGPSLYFTSSLGSTDGSAYFTGVSTLSAYFRDSVSITPGATLRGSWLDGTPMLATKGNVVGVNFFPDASFGNIAGDYQQAIINSLATVPSPGAFTLTGAGFLAITTRRRRR